MRLSFSRRTAMQSAAGSAMLGAFGTPAAAATAQAPIRLYLNENPYGPSDRAKQAMQGALDDGWMYDYEDAAQLRRLQARRGRPLARGPLDPQIDQPHLAVVLDAHANPPGP